MVLVSAIAVRDLLTAAPDPMPPDAVARAFKGRLTQKRRERVGEVLDILTDLGLARTGQRDGEAFYFARK